jgi:release factor glutamine methyltransferase
VADLSIADLLRGAAESFSQAGIDSPELEARLLLQFVLGLDRAALILRWQQHPPISAQEHFASLVTRRLGREPLAYITGEREFWSLPFAVSSAVLIPRPETEFLLEQVLYQVQAKDVRHALDLGSGSGVIAVVLARELGCRVTAVDASAAALQVAAGNARRHGVAERINWLCGDFFSTLPPAARFDLLVSNPPYVAVPAMKQLAPEVRLYEPHLALCGGMNGLDCIAHISRRAGDFLYPGSWVFVEIGADQKEAVHQLFTSSPHRYEDVQVKEDLAGRPRVLTARFAG